MMHVKARQRYEDAIRAALASRPDVVDAVLDQYADALLRATNWDAEQWGLPTPEMISPLAALRHVARSRNLPNWPREII